ncbi:hypothetical protein GDO78_007264 [Eleutherodactylus coqui]|uniref:Uncharacterized protein n=1 Tax=Eleutherodactylus coqui TaxID=57060 RepID=A0A8J6KD49_ELECQ|nr:hypothetical protein GDO78_007264 [Eleutherodactylus coqui]
MLTRCVYCTSVPKNSAAYSVLWFLLHILTKIHSFCLGSATDFTLSVKGINSAQDLWQKRIKICTKTCGF